jgi:hypothetical protein
MGTELVVDQDVGFQAALALVESGRRLLAKIESEEPEQWLGWYVEEKARVLKYRWAAWWTSQVLDQTIRARLLLRAEYLAAGGQTHWTVNHKLSART